MRNTVAFVTASLLVCVVMGAALAPIKRDNSVFRFGEFTVSRTGILSIDGQPAQYLLVPQDRYPAQLRGIAVIDLDDKVYTARFFEPGGIGVEGFFDVCFKVRNGVILTSGFKSAGSLERITGSTYVKSISYVFDSEKRVLLRVDSVDTKPARVSLVDRMKPYSVPAK